MSDQPLEMRNWTGHLLRSEIYSAKMERKSDSVSFLESKDQTCGLAKFEIVLSAARVESPERSLQPVRWISLLHREEEDRSNPVLQSP